MDSIKNSYLKKIQMLYFFDDQTKNIFCLILKCFAAWHIQALGAWIFFGIKCFLVFPVLRHPRGNPFKALKVMLISEDRVDLWTSLLSMGGAAKVHHRKENEDISGG